VKGEKSKVKSQKSKVKSQCEKRSQKSHGAKVKGQSLPGLKKWGEWE